MFLTPKDRLRAIWRDAGVEIRMLLIHPMQLATVADDGQPILSDFIQTIDCWHQQKKIFTMHCSPLIAADPYLSFWLTKGTIGEEVAVRWVDNRGRKGKLTTQIR